MNKDIFDNFFEKAKGVFETTKKKTEETVSIEKMRFNISTLKSKREKEYVKLGKMYYDELKDVMIEDAELKSVVDSISEINENIDELNKQINAVRNKRICPSCGAFVSDNDTFCASCGAKIIFDSQE